MSPKECKQSNWSKVGFSDGAKGSYSEISSYEKSCKKADVIPNRKRYMQGYNKGAQVFCTFSNGVKMGSSNQIVSNICTKTGLEENFNRGYKKGNKIYAKKQSIHKKEQQIVDLNKQIKAMESGNKKGNVKDLGFLFKEKELAQKEVLFLKQQLKAID
jgi:hypothetical protein